MSQQLLLDISAASARSKGQARRRNDPAQSDGARKAQRNIARRERTRCKKTGKTEQQLLLVASNPLRQAYRHANSARSSAQAYSCAGGPQYGDYSSFPSKDKAVLQEKDVLPNPQVSPAHADSSNPRAPAQSSRYIAAQSKAQETNAAVREDGQQFRDVSVARARNQYESEIVPEEQDLDAAGILFQVARKQHPTSSSMDTRSILGKECDAPGTYAMMGYPQKCPITTCPDHDDKSFWRKTERDKHVITHFEGNIKFNTNNGLYSLRWPSFSESPATYFQDIKKVKRTIQNYNQWDLHDVQCLICCYNFTRSGYVDHLEDCIVHTVELHAQGFRALSWDYFIIDPPLKHHRDQPTIKHYWPSLGCGWCYTDLCQCPPMQQMTERSVDDTS